MRNMKIKVENNLGEIVVELERIGYVCNFETGRDKRIIYTFNTGFFGLYSNNAKTDSSNNIPTTLAELKEMQNAK